MFTGIIKAKGQVEADVQPDGFLVVKSALFTEIKPKLGASIAIDGVCLTVCQVMANDSTALGFELGPETLAVTRLGQKKAHDWVNIEPALCAGEPMDGHVVQGHIDGLGEIIKIDPAPSSLVIHCRFAPQLNMLIVNKGAIAINGVSLTINHIEDHVFTVCLIPHTLTHTCFSTNKVGDFVHLETDIMGRYLARMLKENHFATTKTFLELSL